MTPVSGRYLSYIDAAYSVRSGTAVLGGTGIWTLNSAVLGLIYSSHGTPKTVLA